MRPHVALIAVMGIAVLSAGIVMSGARLQQAETAIEPPEITELDVPPDEPAGGPDDPARAPVAPDAAAQDESRRTDPATGLERVAPRPPLSDLASPQQPERPKPIPPDRWRPTRLFNPVATAAGMIEAQGHKLALAGVDPVRPDEKCTFEGREWPCGTQARTAFRLWLRARAVSCKVPPEPDRETLVAECDVGKEDPALWLVENGWAKAAASGPYADAGRKAEAGKKGIFGPPPRPASAVSPLPDPAIEAPEAPPMPPASPPAPSQ